MGVGVVMKHYNSSWGLLVVLIMRGRAKCILVSVHSYCHEGRIRTLVLNEIFV